MFASRFSAQMNLIGLSWDSSYWNKNMAKLEFDGTTGIPADMESYDFIKARIPTTEINIVNLLQDLGFRIYDTLVYLEMDMDKMKLSPPNGNYCRWSTHYRDVEQMRKIASSSFTFDHHHQDPRFDKKKVDEMHALWVNKCIREDYDIDVCEKDDQVTGFIATKKGYIELIAVDSRYRGMGIAEDLLRFALTRAAFDIKKATVETQIANVSAVRLYEKLGFRITNSVYTCHWWRT